MFQALLLALTSSVVDFNGVNLTIPSPAGYCLPSGAAQLTAQQLAASDAKNVTKLTLVNCTPGMEFEDYLNVKVSATAAGLTMSRTEFLQLMKDTFGSSELSTLMQSGKFQSEVESRYRSLGTEDVKVRGGLVPRAIDDVCAYFGGEMAVATGANTKNVSVAACATSINGRIISFYAIKPEEGEDGYEALFGPLREWVRSVDATALITDASP